MAGPGRIMTRIQSSGREQRACAAYDTCKLLLSVTISDNSSDLDGHGQYRIIDRQSRSNPGPCLTSHANLLVILKTTTRVYNLIRLSPLNKTVAGFI